MEIPIVIASIQRRLIATLALAMTQNYHFVLFCGGGRGWVIASECNERGNQQARNPHDSSLAYG